MLGPIAIGGDAVCFALDYQEDIHAKVIDKAPSATAVTTGDTGAQLERSIHGLVESIKEDRQGSTQSSGGQSARGFATWSERSQRMMRHVTSVDRKTLADQPPESLLEFARARSSLAVYELLYDKLDDRG